MANRIYLPLVAFVVVVLITGLFFPALMDYDAAEYAGIAMRMHETGDWKTIINRSYDTGLAYNYLDKPHLLYWSALPGFYLFGVHDYSYRLVTVITSLLGAFVTYRLGSLLYNKTTGQVAGFMFISSQAILLSNHDVRTDSLLTSFVVLALYQLVLFYKKSNWLHLIWAAAYLACGVATKGLIAVLTCGSMFFFFLLATRNLQKIFDWRWLILIPAFFLFLSPVLYFYYLQFDLHPELFVNGKTGNSGIKFILWTQSFERFAGDRKMVDNPEFSFFFHTLLWALLPWSLIYYSSVVNRIKELVQSKGKSFFTREQLSFAGLWAMFLFMSASSFKLPHYINVLFPGMCIAAAAYLDQLQAQKKEITLKRLAIMQWVVMGILVLLAIVLFGWAFPLTSPAIIIAFLFLTSAAIIYYKKLDADNVQKIWVPSLLCILLLNFLLNTHFYPSIDKYQGGSSMAKDVNRLQLNKNDVYLYGDVVRTFDFYIGKWRPLLTTEQLQANYLKDVPMILFLTELSLKKLPENIHFTVLAKEPNYHITGITGKFLNPATRDKTYESVYLIKVNNANPGDLK